MERLKLYAPESYYTTPKEEIDRVTGGCGPGGFGDFLVPDTIYGLSIFEACRRHDWMYHVGEILADKEEADRVFLNNMTRIIKVKTAWRWFPAFRKILIRLRLRRAKTYYFFVDEFGGPAFWDGKNQIEEFREVEEAIDNRGRF